MARNAKAQSALAGPVTAARLTAEEVAYLRDLSRTVATPTTKAQAVPAEIIAALKAAQQALDMAGKALAAAAQAQNAPAPKASATSPKGKTKPSATVSVDKLAAAAKPAKPAKPAEKPMTRAEKHAANKAAFAAERAARPMAEPDGPATASQLWYLHLLLSTDTRTPKYAKLTKAQAARMISDLKAKSGSTGKRSA